MPDAHIEINCTWLKRDAPTLSAVQFRCLLTLGAYVDPWGLCWPSSGRLAEALYDKPVTTRQIRKLLQGLRDASLLMSFQKPHNVTCHAVNRAALSFGPEPRGYAWSEPLLLNVAHQRCKPWQVSRPKVRPGDPCRLGHMTTEELAHAAGVPVPPYDEDPIRLAAWQQQCLSETPHEYTEYIRLTILNKAEPTVPPHSSP